MQSWRVNVFCVTVLLTCFYRPATALQVETMSPSNNATGVCCDSLLRLTFDAPPKLGNSGTVRIYNVSDPSIPVDTIDLSLGNLQPKSFPGDAQMFNAYAVIINGNTATIYPHAATLASNETYFVTVDSGFFVDSNNVSFGGITDSNAWRFTTKTTGPADPLHLVVAADGRGDFCTVQGAVDFIPPGNTTPTLINIRDGDYVEIVNVSGKNYVIFRGQNREGTVVGYANNASIAPSGTTHARMAFKVNADDIAVDNLTITNRTPQGGSQAEALMLETDIKRFIANNVKVASYQDTILANTSGTQGYLYNSLVQGDVDFIWGGGNLFFTNCEIRSLRSSSDITQPRTDAGSNGMSFVNCQITRSSPGITGCRFARPLGYGFSSVAFIRCRIDAHITGWDPSLLVGRGGTLNPNLRWWEHGNSNLMGTAAVVYNGHQIGQTNGDPRLELAQSDINWLYGWQPQLLPNIVSQPANQSVGHGQAAQLSVLATGIPDPTYQWLHYGTNIPGEIDSAILFASASDADAGPYSVVVSNAAGAVVSAPATLTVLNLPPAPGVTTVETAQDTPVSLAVAKLLLAATDPEGDAFELTGVSPLSTNNGIVSLLPGAVIYAPPAGYVGADAFSYTLMDALGAASNISVMVSVTSTNLPGANQVGEIEFTSGTARVTFAGIPDRTYGIERSDSMVNPVWTRIGEATADAQGRLVFVDTSPPAGQAYYRTTEP